ncbi:unnamed protein product [Amoebophrya sp. A25]|nr:unnamed protein product [Amoebophrya sp. A25]|eukprot:GSA25T00024774001.1
MAPRVKIQHEERGRKSYSYSHRSSFVRLGNCFITCAVVCAATATATQQPTDLHAEELVKSYQRRVTKSAGNRGSIRLGTTSSSSRTNETEELDAEAIVDEALHTPHQYWTQRGLANSITHLIKTITVRKALSCDASVSWANAFQGEYRACKLPKRETHAEKRKETTLRTSSSGSIGGGLHTGSSSSTSGGPRRLEYSVSIADLGGGCGHYNYHIRREDTFRQGAFYVTKSRFVRGSNYPKNDVGGQHDTTKNAADAAVRTKREEEREEGDGFEELHVWNNNTFFADCWNCTVFRHHRWPRHQLLRRGDAATRLPPPQDAKSYGIHGSERHDKFSRLHDERAKGASSSTAEKKVHEPLMNSNPIDDDLVVRVRLKPVVTLEGQIFGSELVGVNELNRDKGICGPEMFKLVHFLNLAEHFDNHEKQQADYDKGLALRRLLHERLVTGRSGDKENSLDPGHMVEGGRQQEQKVIEPESGGPYFIAAMKGNGGVDDIKASSASMPTTFDWVVSLEVGEHIPKGAPSEAYFSNLVRLARVGIILSWGIPGQEGWGHVNLQSNTWVQAEMLKRGFAYEESISEAFRQRAITLFWFRESLMVFRKM